MGKTLKGWVEIFRAGKHTDSSGRVVEFSLADLDKTVRLYKPDQHEAPVVVGHPKDNAPAYGWVRKLKRDGTVLLAMFKQLAPEFEEMAIVGRFKKRSISLYPNGSLRHVGFLGAQPPAVKGLKDFSFGQGDECHCYEFNEPEEVDMDEVEKLKAKLAKETERADKAEGQAEEFKKTADKATANFAVASNAAAASAKKQQRKEIADFVEQGVKDGKMLPGWKDGGLVDFMCGLEENEQVFEFGEGRKETAAQWFKGFISSFSEHPLFKEMVKPGKEGEGEDADFAEAEAIARDIAGSTGVEV